MPGWKETNKGMLIAKRFGFKQGNHYGSTVILIKIRKKCYLSLSLSLSLWLMMETFHVVT